MSLPAETTGQLAIYAQLGVGFAGFAGVVGAFSRFRIHVEATAFRVRAMVTIALAEVVFALLPGLIASFGVSEVTTWRIATGAIALGGSVALVVFARQASVLYKIGRLFRIAAYILCSIAAVIIAPMYALAFGVADGFAPPWYFTLLFFGVILCAYHFTMVMIAVRLDESE